MQDSGITPPPSTQAPAPSAAEAAYTASKAAILDGDFPAGSMISEGDVAARLGISRTPVREAFLRLSAEGWLRLYPKRGALVVPPEPGEAADIFQARLLLEGAGVRNTLSGSRAVEQHTSLCQRLEEILEQQREAHAKGDLSAFTEADLRFHRCITLSSGNRLLVSFHESLNDRERRMNTRSLWRQEESSALVLTQHAGLIDAIRSADAELFVARLKEHLETVHARFLSP